MLKVKVTERQDQKGSREFTVPDTTLVIRFIRDALVAMKSSKATFDIENMRMKKTFTDLEGKTLKEISRFVSEKLAPIDSVMTTATHFILKKYKDHGTILTPKAKAERVLVMP